MSLPAFIDDFKQVVRNNEPFDFNQWALTIFDYQSKYNAVFRQYLKLIRYDSLHPILEEIPHLPISFFKRFPVVTGDVKSNLIFRSSATTNKGQSMCYVHDPVWYEDVSKYLFEKHFITQWNIPIVALLPGYLERSDSSLIYMVNHFMNLTQHPANGFYLQQYQSLAEVICREVNNTMILFGVPFGLLDFIESIGPINAPNLIIIETGGMKGRGKEMPKKVFHDLCREQFNTQHIYSEYGMTELLSQAYTHGSERFSSMATIRVHTKELNDPFESQLYGKAGTINVIDLANIHTCSFIETEDLGIRYDESTFEVLGRIDNREIRGCNLLVS